MMRSQIPSQLFSRCHYIVGYFGPDCTSHPNSIPEEEKLHPVQARSSGAFTLALWAEEGAGKPITEILFIFGPFLGGKLVQFVGD